MVNKLELVNEMILLIKSIEKNLDQIDRGLRHIAVRLYNEQKIEQEAAGVVQLPMFKLEKEDKTKNNQYEEQKEKVKS